MTTARVKIQESFDFTINETTFAGFTKDSSWEGLHKLRNAEGQFVIVDRDPLHHNELEIIRVSGDLT